MSGFGVSPDPVAAGGARLVGTGRAVSAVRAGVNGASAMAGAMGNPVSASAYGNMCDVWERELENLGEALAGTGQTTIWAATLYRIVDRAVMPGP